MPKLYPFIAERYAASQKPASWYAKANDLREAAQTLLAATLPKVREYQAAYTIASDSLDQSGQDFVEIECSEPQLLPVYFLYGAALENLFKAKIALGLAEGESFSSKLMIHRLIDLAAAAAISLDPREAELIAWIEEVLEWKGRYQTPKPRRAERYGIFFVRDHLIVEMLDESVKTIEALFARIEADISPQLPAPRSIYPVLVRVSPEDDLPT